MKRLEPEISCYIRLPPKKIFLNCDYLIICLFMFEGMCAMAWLWRSEDSFSELILSFLHVGPGIQTKVFCFHPPDCLTHPNLHLDKREMLLPKIGLQGGWGMSGLHHQGRGMRTSGLSVF